MTAGDRDQGRAVLLAAAVEAMNKHESLEV